MSEAKSHLLVEITDDAHFRKVVQESNTPVLVDFWATWCGPCQMQTPVLERVAQHAKGRAVIAKVNVDDHPDLAMEFQVHSIPTLLVFNQGSVTGKMVGLQREETLRKALGL